MVLGADVDHEKVAGAETIFALVGDPVPGDPVTSVTGGGFRANAEQEGRRRARK